MLYRRKILLDANNRDNCYSSSNDGKKCQLLFVYLLVSNNAYIKFLNMHLNFNTTDIANLGAALQAAKLDNKKEISFEELLEFGYDKTKGNALIYSAMSFRQYIEKVENRNGIYYAILKH